jgi:multidrug efflux system membrane fusion protein
VRAQFDNPDNALFPNQFVNAQLLVNTLHDVVTVPVAAIQRGAPGSYVYLVNADNTVSVRPIKTGPADGPTAQVVSGLSAGERVVVDGTDRLRDGARVTIPGAAAAPATTPAGQPHGAEHGQNRRGNGNQ